jgi:hypothetical protein
MGSKRRKKMKTHKVTLMGGLPDKPSEEALEAFGFYK